MYIVNMIKEIIRKDRYVSENRAKETRKAQMIISLIAGVGFLIMSILNVRQESYVMLWSTLAGAVLLIASFILTLFSKNGIWVKISFCIILVVVFPLYILNGGNEGFAALWIGIIVYLSMYFLDFKIGFIINIYYLIVILVALNVPVFYMPDGVPIELYTDTFRMRFPMFYLINFAFATYINTRSTQYELIISRQNYKDLSIRDLNTGLYNRNAYFGLLKDFDASDLAIICAIYIDANGLHEINNEKGHQAGDDFLKAIADKCKEVFSGEENAIYRMGGDEFLVLARNKGCVAVKDKAQRVHDELEKHGYSIAFGIECQSQEYDVLKLVDVANKRMLENKANYYASKEHDRRQMARTDN